MVNPRLLVNLRLAHVRLRRFKGWKNRIDSGLPEVVDQGMVKRLDALTSEATNVQYILFIYIP